MLPEHCDKETGWAVIVIISLTVNTDEFEVTGLHGDTPLTMTLYEPASVTLVFDNANVADVAPVMLPPFERFVVPFLHWYDKPLPVAVTLIVTGDPEQTDWLATGCTVITGA